MEWCLALMLAVLIIGPQRVAAEVRKLLGYIPGFGLVEQNTSLRVLAEPVIQTRDGITLTVKQAFLTPDKTEVTYRLEGVPWSAYSHNENVGGCSGAAELRLPDGTLLNLTGGGGTLMEIKIEYPPIPANVNQTTFVLPCIQDTLPGLAPEQWELPLRFVPAPSDLTVLPVIDITPSPIPQAETAVSVKNPLALLKVIDMGDSYILLGEFRPGDAGDLALSGGSRWSLTGPVTITDAAGQDVFYTIPNEPGLQLPPGQAGAEAWMYQIGKTFTPPLTITYPGQFTVPADPNAMADIDFDAGTAPQSDQQWTLNQGFELAGHKVTLVSIQAVSETGYRFSFRTSDRAVREVDVAISGYAAQGGGGGGSPTPGEWWRSLDYANRPTGKLKLALSNLSLNGESRTWQLQWSPASAQPNSPSLYGISLAVDRYIPLADGYYLIGHTEWSDGRVSSVWPAAWGLKAYDSKGQEVALEPGNWQEAGLAPEADQWLVHLYGKSFNAPLTLRATNMNVEFKQSVKLTLDLRTYGFNGSDSQLGMAWKTGQIPLDVPGLLANAFKVTYVKLGDMVGFEIGIEADPALQGLPFTITSGLNTDGLSGISSGGGSNRDEANGLVLSTILTNAKITFPLVFNASGATVNGTWEASWTPPAGEPGATPATAPQACVTLEAWKQVAVNLLPIPAGLPTRALVSRGAISPDPSLFIASLDGSTAQGLVFGQGSLSPDGTQLVYSGADNHLYMMNIPTGQSLALTEATFDSQPLWSPDGTRIAFSRLTDKGYNIFVMDADGRAVRALTDNSENFMVGGWTPDGQKVIGVSAQGGGIPAQLFEVGGGTAQTLDFIRQPGDENISISPDGQWVAFTDKVPGRMTPGIFVSRLDGTEQRLLVQLDSWSVGLPLWSPDGDWLAFGVVNTDVMQPESTPALVNLKTCQVVPLSHLRGEIRGWVK